MKNPGCFIFLLCLIAAQAAGQVDYNKQYFNAKQLFREGKYNLAMESFKALIPYDQKKTRIRNTLRSITRYPPTTKGLPQ